MATEEIEALLKQGTKRKVIAEQAGVSLWKVAQIKKGAGIKVKVPRGKNSSLMAVNSVGKLKYKSSTNKKRISRSEFYGF